MTSCSGTLAYRNDHNLSLQTLVIESPSSLLKIAEFDTWIQHRISFDLTTPAYRIQQGIGMFRKRKKTDDDSNIDIRYTKKILVVLDTYNLNKIAICSNKIVRID